VANGAIELGGRKFTTLVTTFEPFPSKKLLSLMSSFVESGGRLIWSGPPPVLTAEGDSALSAWERIFGVNYQPREMEGVMAPGMQVNFGGVLAKVTPQIILTDFLVDRIYPVTPKEGSSPVARVKDMIIGTYRTYPSGGTATFLGYRPRDDQSKSLGYETRNWFEVLNTLGAYPGTGRFEGINDSTEYISRTTDYLACRFPNGALAVTHHLRETEEDWSGMSARDEKADAEYIKRCPPPSEALQLNRFKINGHTVTYDGTQAVTFRLNAAGTLIAFSGNNCQAITIDGKKTVFADRVMPTLAWAPVRADRRIPGGAVLQLISYGTGHITIPAADLPKDLQLVIEGTKPGSRGGKLECSRKGANLVFDITPEASGHWIYGVSATGK
jgi:hypothetical protein